MRCPHCVAAGAPHTLQITNARPANEFKVEEWWDEKDRLHTHDHQVRPMHLHCSNNHNFTILHLSRCPCLSCDWNKQEAVTTGLGWPKEPT